MHFSKHVLAIAVAFSIAAVPGWSQVASHRPAPSASASSAKPKAMGMGNADVIALATAGLPDDIVIAKIHAAPLTNFDTSLDGLKSLKAANVSNAVIRAMIDPQAAIAVPASAPAPAPSASSAAVASNPDDPAQVHAPGIYILVAGLDKRVHLTKLDHIVPKQSKTSGMLAHALTYGAVKAHVKAVIDGPKATVQTPETNPTFYAYIPEDNTTFGGSSITVKDFSLVQFEVKGGQRQVSTTTIGFAGASAGVDETSRQGFTSELVKPGIYKLTLLKPLPAGEYAFQQSGSQSSASGQQNTGAYFDFGIISGQ